MNSRKQLHHSRIQTFFCIVAAVCCMLLMLNVRSVMPQVTALAEQADQVLANLEAVTEELTKLDLASVLDNINSLVTTSQTGVEEAMDQILQIDVKTLNQAIKDLSDIVKPLADLANLTIKFP